EKPAPDSYLKRHGTAVQTPSVVRRAHPSGDARHAGLARRALRLGRVRPILPIRVPPRSLGQGGSRLRREAGGGAKLRGGGLIPTPPLRRAAPARPSPKRAG